MVTPGDMSYSTPGEEKFQRHELAGRIPNLGGGTPRNSFGGGGDARYLRHLPQNRDTPQTNIFTRA
jgi:hypothetical protein